MRAVLIALLAFWVNRIGHSLVLITNNCSVATYLNKQVGTVPLSLCQLTQEMMTWTELHAVEITRDNPEDKYCNGPADSLRSIHHDRMVISSFRILGNLFGLWKGLNLFPCHVKKSQASVSQGPDSMTWKENTSQHPWDHLDFCAFPLFSLIC